MIQIFNMSLGINTANFKFTMTLKQKLHCSLCRFVVNNLMSSQIQHNNNLTSNNKVFHELIINNNKQQTMYFKLLVFFHEITFNSNVNNNKQ